MNTAAAIVSDIAAEPPSILIVDDTPANLGVVMDSLADKGFRVLVALDGNEALERAQFSQPDLILLDVKMPGIDGFETCRRLKADPRTHDIAVIFMTSLTGTAHLLEGFSAGGVDYITKPVQVAEMMARIGTHLALRSMYKQLVAQNSQLQNEIAVRERTEIALSRARDELEARVAKRTEELARANASLTLEIDERRRVEAKRVASEARFRTIVETSPVPFCITSMPDGELLFANEPMRQLFGFDDTTSRGINMGDFYVDATLRDQLVQHLRREGAFRNFEVQFRRPNGTMFWATVTSRVATYDDAPAIYNGLNDVTARRAQAEALRKSAASLANAQRLAHLGDWGWDARLGMTHWSDEVYNILGLTETLHDLHKPPPSYRTFAAAVHPDDRHALRRTLRALVRGARAEGIDLRVVCPGGAIRIVRLEAEALYAPGQGMRPSKLVGTIQDITERKRIEQELFESREQLRELSNYMEGIREEERKRIAMEIHDELGQLLTALKMDVALMRMRLGDGDAEAKRKSDDMRELVEKTIWMVRNVASHLRPAALNFGIVSALEWLAEDFGRRTGIACRVRVRGGEPVLNDAHATAVFRIVQASLTNVARHAGASRVDVTLDNDSASLALQIGDDGCGFDPDEAKKGYSYGLLGMEERARLIGASLQIDSAPGTGTVVSIHMPLIGGPTT
ncbi:response regulator [Trinickia violacea]|uniref:Response regulator n=1 Tax=Trinickia violacea TaxID=2571746 RepID=A0A4P8J269_9BURK|nr:response regulator [Trinickia violacea]QCP54133.1 response regulator [Trinickia violacea]